MASAFFTGKDWPSASGSYGDAPGRCIYCPNPPTGDEHIVPFCLGGKAYLPMASCDACGKVTSYLEGYLCRAVFGPFRVLHKVQSRSRRGIDLEDVAVMFKTANGEPRERSIPRGQLPTVLALPEMMAPGMLHPQTGAPMLVAKVWTYFIRTHAEILLKLMQEDEVSANLGCMQLTNAMV